MTHDTPPLAEGQVLGRALRRWRILNRVKQSAAAELLGVSQTTISRWETLVLAPQGREARRLQTLLSARPRAASDIALLDLVRLAPTPMHLICDLTHRLLAASAGRARQWRVSPDDLAGASLWRFATDGIRRGEGDLAAKGWYEPVAPDVTIATEGIVFPQLTISAGEIGYTRIPLSDGRHARLVRERFSGA